jgi:hypothetical protein
MVDFDEYTNSDLATMRALHESIMHAWESERLLPIYERRLLALQQSMEQTIAAIEASIVSDTEVRVWIDGEPATLEAYKDYCNEQVDELLRLIGECNMDVAMTETPHDSGWAGEGWMAP